MHEREQAVRYEQALGFAGQLVRGDDHLIGICESTLPLVMPPTGRHVHVIATRDVETLPGLLDPIRHHIVAVGSNAPERAKRLAPDHARLSPLGRMQTPPTRWPRRPKTALVPER